MQIRSVSCLLVVAALFAACGDDSRPVGFDSGPIGGDGGPGVDGGPGTDGSTEFCTDEDMDGYGDGCTPGPDCDDTNAAISPAATETCNGVDDNCDTMADEDLVAPTCEMTEGVCAGATARCGGVDGFLACDATDYGADYEADETNCDSLDNDCDGTTDEGCTCTDGMTQACGSDVGVCMAGTQTCVDSAWGPCEDEVAPMGEVCDGMDNDCDAMDDEAADLVAPACPLTLGVCAGSMRTCGGGAGWIACSGTASYGGDNQSTESLCDRLDNDCDGVTDPGCACIDGATQSCGSDVGSCTAGTQTCVAGGFGGCAGEVAPVPETCDGEDEDCDGTTDETVTAPSCALTMGVCAGSSQTCSGAGGFVACNSTSYGPSYQATETSCDGRDNDCDGITDEGCDCVDGTTQACGISTGACERGTQTCAAGAWGACMGAVNPVPETCNGLDDDCNGASDDGLMAPACSLIQGVCAGSVQTCGGAAGWLACSGTASYGSRYVATEDGATNEAICDGLDNDCDGAIDDMCASGPLVAGTEDAVIPGLYHKNLAYSVMRGGNFEIVYQNLDRGMARQITTTAQDELGVRISGDRLVFVRGTGAAARAVMYDLATSTETVLSSAETGNVDIAANIVVWDQLNAGQWDVVVRNLITGSNTTLPGTGNEYGPSVRGGRIAYIGTFVGRDTVHVVTFDPGTGMWSAPAVQTPGSTAGVGHPDVSIDFVMAGWTDGRSITGTPALTSDWDAYFAPFTATTGLNTYPGENLLVEAIGAEIVRNVDSQITVLDDQTTGDWNVDAAFLGSAALRITSSTATQAAITNSGSHLVWHDNRLGSFDIFQSFYAGATFLADPGDVLIAEVLADPAPGADPNGDGAASTTNDEFVEIVNVSPVAIDIGGLTLSDATGVRHTFPAGTFVPSLGIVVVFGGGTPTGTFGGATVMASSTGQLGFNNGADTLTLSRGATVIDTVSYGAEAGADQSIVRDTTTTFVQHTTIPGSIGAYSVGVYADGYVP